MVVNKYQAFNHNITNIIKYPHLSNKAVELMTNNCYSFVVARYANKASIKTAIENLFDVKVLKVRTCYFPKKKKRVGRFLGSKAQYKKAIITVKKGYVIQIFT